MNNYIVRVYYKKTWLDRLQALDFNFTNKYEHSQIFDNKFHASCDFWALVAKHCETSCMKSPETIDLQSSPKNGSQVIVFNDGYVVEMFLVDTD